MARCVQIIISLQTFSQFHVLIPILPLLRAVHHPAPHLAARAHLDANSIRLAVQSRCFNAKICWLICPGEFTFDLLHNENVAKTIMRAKAKRLSLNTRGAVHTGDEGLAVK